MKHLKYVLGFALGVGLVALFLWNTNLGLLWQAIRGADRGLLAAAFALTLVSYVLRAIRWHYLVLPIKRARFSGLFEGIVVGFTVSNLLPGKLGEVVRPYILSVRDGFKVSALFATVVVDRIFDAAGVGLLLGVYLVTLDPRTASPRLKESLGALKASGVGAMAAVVVLLGFLWLLRWRTAPTLRLAAFLLKPLPARLRLRAVGMLEHFAHGLSILADVRGMALALAWSVVIWAEIALSHWLVIRAFDVALPLQASFLLIALMVIGVAIPTPGGMGGLQWTCAWGIGLAASPLPDTAVVEAASMAVWGNSFLPVTLVGLVYLWKEGLSLGRIEAIGEQVEASVDEEGATRDPGREGAGPREGSSSGS
jgi:uncharacterized protein (TIRG00374 family)